jgi:iron complex outermembrane receptor protein
MKVIGSAIGFDPTQSVYDAKSHGGYFEWLEANGNLPLYQQKSSCKIKSG